MDFLEVNPDNLSPTKLGFISFGGLGGVGVGLLLSLLITAPVAKLTIGIFLFCLSLYLILKNIKLLLL